MGIYIEGSRHADRGSKQVPFSESLQSLERVPVCRSVFTVTLRLGPVRRRFREKWVVVEGVTTGDLDGSLPKSPVSLSHFSLDRPGPFPDLKIDRRSEI